jgi:hypothetical protein
VGRDREEGLIFMRKLIMNIIRSIQEHRLFDHNSMDAATIAQFIEEIMAQDWFEVFHQDLGWQSHPIFKPIEKCRLMIQNIIVDVLTEKGMEIFFADEGINKPHRYV